ncbi:ANTAR domain-containing protein [Cellulomonas hominis]|uniref:ANTAR domain-containing protein n=1 Tax=Cellulomonas hominis TaxID=156981 RepID=UPI001B988871|nr:ANTAR domain-containing protein [Cellulomonas hominis]VTR77441.1 hypothetical protein CHMI_02210 [Cellulomonas hominis]
MTERVHLLRALARAVADQGAGPVAERMCRAAVELLDGDGAALTCSPTEPTRFTACATDELAARLDEAEEVVGDGPGLRAFRERRSVGAVLGRGAASGAPPGGSGGGADVEDLPAFEVLAGQVAPGGVHVRAWPVRAWPSPSWPEQSWPEQSWRAHGTPEPVAVLTVHGVPAQRGTDLVADGQVLADALAPVLLGAAALGASDRADLHLAVGMVVGQTGLPPDDAHALLRGRAWSQDQRLADVVRQVLDRRVTFPRPDGPGRPAG